MNLYKDLQSRILDSTFNGKKILMKIPNSKIKFLKTFYSIDFLNSQLYNDIVNATSFLPKDIDNRIRIKAIFMEIHTMEKCPICGKDKAITKIHQLNGIFFLDNCGNKTCWSAQIRSHISKIMSDQTKLRHSIAQSKYKQQLVIKYVDLIKRIKNSQSNDLFSLEYLKSNISERITKQVANQHLFKECDIDNFKLMDSIFKLTTFIELPIEITTKKDLRLDERAYCILHDMHDFPRCKYCGTDGLKFLSIKKGYVQSCPNCAGDMFREKVGYPTLNQIMNSIDASKYEIINFPHKTDKEKLVVKCKKCGSISEHYIYDGRGKNISNAKLCRNCEKYSSNKEYELRDFLKTIYKNNNVQLNTKEIISPYELDIYLPDKKVAVEFDGLFWHSIDKTKTKNYHLNKTLMCEKKGIRLIHIFEDEWDNKKQIVKSRLKHILVNNQRKIFARKCIVKEIDNKTKNIFLEKYHLQGRDNSQVHLGLYYNNHLVACMTFSKSRFNKNYQWELYRYATVSNFTIVGGASKLLKHFERNFNPKSLITYADRRWSNGNLYVKLGFTFSHSSSPNYFYTKNCERLSRLKFQKHKLKNILKVFDPTKSEFKNMEDNGYFRIFDCGNLVFVKTYN